mmetsp:Transcript_69074/g.179446  ORF Transcript_69074/g.179446 Transcript_69074/m.179446 type:complete len:332 (-) Transcript_69074:24-1019(-)
MLGAGAEVKLAEKRILVRITVIGAGESGKTSLINAFVNNVFHEKNPPTEHIALYYTTCSVSSEEENLNAPKFNTLLEIEDTPAFEKMDDKILGDLFDPFWPKPEHLAMNRIPRDEEDKETKRKRSVNLPFSMCIAPVAQANDSDNLVTLGDSPHHPNAYFCGKSDWKDRKCCPSNDFQCKSCRRFQASISPEGEYRTLCRRRMIYLLVYDVNDQESYLKVLGLFSQLQETLAKKDLKQWPLIYIVGNKIDKDPESKAFKDISAHIRDFARSEIDAGRKLSTCMVSAMHFKNVTKLFRTLLQDIRTREPLWKVDPLGGDGGPDSQENRCVLQ